MNVIVVLLIILFVSMRIVGGKRGSKSFFTLCFNFIAFFMMLILITLKLDPIKVTLFISIIISSITLFYINGVNKKTVASLLSVISVVIITLILTYKIGNDAKLQGFGREQMISLESLSLYVELNFTKIFTCQVLIGLLGAIIDVSISIASSMNEIYKNDTSISQNSIFISGMNIGKDILGTMTNTLFFAYISGFMTLVIYFSKLNYSVEEILNLKAFGSEIFQILCSGIGIILIIPATAFITSKILFLNIRQNSDLPS